MILILSFAVAKVGGIKQIPSILVSFVMKLCNELNVLEATRITELKWFPLCLPVFLLMQHIHWPGPIHLGEPHTSVHALCEENARGSEQSIQGAIWM